MSDVHISVNGWILLGAVVLVVLAVGAAVAYTRYATQRRRKSERASAAAALAGTADWLFVGPAAEYYIAGRYALLAQLSPVCANFLHHAVEMFLTAALNKKLNLEQLKELNHDLPKIWARFCREFPATPQSPWTKVVSDLHRFEDLRYPDVIVKEGVTISIGPGPRPKTSLRTTTASESHYELWLGEIDELVDVILRHGSISPDFAFTRLMRSETREFLSRMNTQPWSQRP